VFGGDWWSDHNIKDMEIRWLMIRRLIEDEDEPALLSRDHCIHSIYLVAKN